MIDQSRRGQGQGGRGKLNGSTQRFIAQEIWLSGQFETSMSAMQLLFRTPGKVHTSLAVRGATECEMRGVVPIKGVQI